LPCIPASWSKKFPCLANSEVFYDEANVPSYLESGQIEATEYLFQQRHVDIVQERLHGKNESDWKLVTVDNFLAKMLNPNRCFTELNDNLMKYPSDLSNSTKLTQPKPDYILGVTLDVVDDLFIKCGLGLGENPAKFIIPLQQVDRVFNQFNEKSRFVGGIAHKFCLPLFVLERESMSGGAQVYCFFARFGGEEVGARSSDHRLWDVKCW